MGRQRKENRWTSSAKGASSPASPATSFEIWPIGRLKRYEGNAKRHPPEQIEQLRASLREFGWTIPLLVRENGVLIAGHGRLDAAELEGFTDAPATVARGWSEEQCRAYTWPTTG
jgi:hypothetical protein